MSESTNSAPESSESAPAAEAAAIESAVQETESIDMSAGGEGPVEDAVEASEEAPSDQQVDAAATKVKAKEVKGSDGELFKIKVDGQEIEVKREEMVRLAQMGKAGQKAMEEKATYKKQVQAFVEALRNDPESVLEQDLGIDKVKLAQKILAKQFEEEAKSPEQKERERLEAELAAYKKKVEDAESKRIKDEYEAEVAKHSKEYEAQIISAFEEAKLPRKPIFLHRMADLMEGAVAKGIDASPAQIAKLIKEDWIRESREALEAFDDDTLSSTLGDTIQTRLRKAHLRKVKSAPSAKVNTSAAGIKTEEKPKETKKIAWKDFIKG